MDFTPEQIAEALRVRMYYQYRLVFLARDPNTNEVRIITGISRAKANNLLRKGWTVSQVTQ
jgi:hypothetical protein